MVENKFAERLKELREENQLSQKQLAQQINVSDVAVSRWESKQRIPNIDSLISLALYFQVSAGYLLGLED